MSCCKGVHLQAYNPRRSHRFMLCSSDLQHAMSQMTCIHWNPAHSCHIRSSSSICPGYASREAVADPYEMLAEFLPDNPYDTLSEGCDFARNHMPDTIDYATIHLWPDSWLSGGQCSEEAALRFARRWINAHVDCCARLGKPLVLTEFGKKPAGPPRATFYQKVSPYSHHKQPKQERATEVQSPASKGALRMPKVLPTIPSQSPCRIPSGFITFLVNQRALDERGSRGLMHSHAWPHRCMTLPSAMPCAGGHWGESCSGWWQPAAIPTTTSSPAVSPAQRSPVAALEPTRLLCTPC